MSPEHADMRIEHHVVRETEQMRLRQQARSADSTQLRAMPSLAIQAANDGGCGGGACTICICLLMALAAVLALPAIVQNEGIAGEYAKKYIHTYAPQLEKPLQQAPGPCRAAS